MKSRLHRVFFEPYLGLRFGWMLAICGLAVAALFAVLVPTVTLIDRHYSKATCDGYAAQANRQTRWVSYTFFTYECLTRIDEHGEWISTDQLRDVNP